MSRFLRKLFAFAAIQLTILTALYLRSRSENADEFFAAAIDKHRRANSIEEPKILVVGGSNVAFGIDSPELERRLLRPVVNLGLHASVGLEFMLREAEAVADPGDIVVLSPEYEQFLANEASPAIVLRILEHRPESGGYLTVGSAGPFLDQGLLYLHGITRRGLRPRRNKDGVGTSAKQANNPYFRSAFNKQGDVVAHHRMTSTYKPTGTAANSPSSGERSAGPSVDRQVHATVDRTNAFIARCRCRNIAVFFAHPPRARGSTADVRDKLEFIDRALRDRLEAPLLTRFEQLLFEDSLFFDTCYHPTESGKKIRTAAIADALETALVGEKSTPSPPTADRNVQDTNLDRTAEGTGPRFR